MGKMVHAHRHTTGTTADPPNFPLTPMVVKFITGTLPCHASGGAASKAATNAIFNREVTYDVNYLVGSRFDTDKPKRAASSV